MLKIARKWSVSLSQALCVLLIGAILAGAICMPMVAKIMLALAYQTVAVPAGGYGLVLALAYGILAVCALADVLLFILLRRVRRGQVFTAKSIGLVRGISWCAILMGVFFLLLGYFFQLALAMAFAGLFLGLCIRVVKNVIEEATSIKAENDLTV